MKGKTVDELCNSQPGTFKEFIQKKEALQEAIENERKERIRAAQKAAQEMAWAA
jgi:hypothetical protein